MIFAIFYLIVCGIAIIVALNGKDLSVISSTSLLNDVNLILCFGIISICSRLDRILTKLMEHKGDRK